MVEADSHLKLLPTSILDIYKVFEHIDMLSMGIQCQLYIVIPTLLGSDFGVLGCGDGPTSNGQTTCRIFRTSHSALR
jgi:hypothetical protein